jgi:hypothetical protein
MRTTALFTLAAAVYLGTASAGQAKPHAGRHAIRHAVHAAEPVWKPDPKLLRQLDPERTIEGSGLRAPSDYTYITDPQGGIKRYIWQGAPRTDNTAPVMAVITGHTEARAQPGGGIKNVVDAYVRDMKRNIGSWQESAYETGRIGGRRFVRIRWSGVANTHSRRTRGFVYGALSGKSYVILTGQDVEPYPRESKVVDSHMSTNMDVNDST